MNRRIVLVGNVVADLVLDVPALPERGGDVLATRTELTAGGGFNTLVAARRLGIETVYAGLHGTGPYGDLVRSALAREDIHALLPPRTDGDTGFTVALVDDGERTFVTSFGIEGRLTREETARVRAELRTGDLVQLSGYALALPSNGPLLAEFAAGLPDGVGLSLDPGPLVADIPDEVLSPVLARVDWLSCNTREARLLGGTVGADAAASLRRRLRDGAGVLVRADSDGCWLAAPGSEPVHVPGFPVTAVDSNGAGDAHVGAFLALLGEGRNPLTAAQGANAAAAYAVSRRGPATAPTRSQLLGFLGSAAPADQLRTPEPSADGTSAA
ncbi:MULTISPECIES: PfkB family carbohydrate kinase [unclassified Streptomyces]|uniref:PfkB family carbohydrate kinase n=1 Tax=unclassified Streptomyces TaxID=2593676 RepID=UPI003329F60B